MRLQLLKTQKKKNLLMVVLIAGLFLYSLFMWLSRGDKQFLLYAILAAAMGAMLAYLNFFLPALAAKRQLPLIREKNGGLSFRFEFREDGLAAIAPTGEQTALTPYSAFCTLSETPELLLLLTESKQMILLDRSRFEGGTEEDFRRLIREKCPGVSLR